MEAVNILLKQKVDKKIKGLQMTEKVPVYFQKEQRWQNPILNGSSTLTSLSNSP